MSAVFIVIGLMAVAGVGAISVGKWRWGRATAALHRELNVLRKAAEPRTVDLGEVEGLPPIVRKYFRTALTDGQPILEMLAVEQTGWFNMSESGEQWKPLVASQRVVTRERGFVWDARVRVVPGISAFVWDAYVGGRGILLGKVLGLRTVVRAEGSDLAEGELLRFLAEAPWYPTALLPSQGVHWEAVDDSSARASLEDRGLAVAVVFRFDEGGLPSSFHVERRGRWVDGVSVATRWEGDYRDYQQVSQMMVPLKAEVRWAPPAERPHAYFRGHFTRLTYEPTL